MDQNFEIEILAPSGLAALSAFLSKSPIELDLIKNESGDFVLEQNVCSQIAGFELEAHEGSVFIFSLYVSHKSPETADSVIPRFSEFLRAAEFPHKITEILHEVDFDEEWISYQWQLNT